jgi:O-antigen/teichoic acid export membrane protein
MVCLALAGLVSTAGLYVTRWQLADWFSNPMLAEYVLPLGLFLTFTLASTVLEIVMVSRNRNLIAAVTYAASDIVRTLLFIGPAILFVSVKAVFVGATVFAGIRLVGTIAVLWREFGRELRMDLALLRQQAGYALPFAMAVGLEVIMINYHQYVVASHFDAATFAVYAVGCLQIPLYDLIVTSTVNVLMVRMAAAPAREHALRLWHDTVTRIAVLIFPLTVLFCSGAHYLIVGLFTSTYEGSVPIFRLWSLTMLPAVMAVDAVLRVYAQTRFLLVMNIVRFACVAGLIGLSMSLFGLNGAVLVTLTALAITKVLGVIRVAWLMQATVADMLPWRRLAGIAGRSLVSAVPTLWLQHEVFWPPLVTFLAGAALYALTYGALTYGQPTPYEPELDGAKA